jgi:Tol biopolymer transport system component
MDRWARIEEVYHAARGLRREQRSPFLDQQHALDSGMRRTIDALLEHDAAADCFLDRPAIEMATDWEPGEPPATLSGRSIGRFEVLELIGSGGMGHVYRARDRTLQRDVALKVLPAEVMLDADRLARFRREAQVLATLNHPNIAAIHGFEEAADVQALVLELVEGLTLADVIARGPIAFEEALPLARQIVDALEAAHEQGVVHRDLKPANIKVRVDGTVKVLDFGLAKMLDGVGSNADPSNVSPGITNQAAIHMGRLLGTPAYMSPERVKGAAADKRSDVWAFGCVLFEMLTGKRAFGGETVADTLTAVLRDAPDWTAWPDAVPIHVRALVEECLQKNRSQRIADLSTARFVIDERRTALTAGFAPRIARHESWRKPLALVAAVAAVAIVAWNIRPSGRNAGAGVTRFSIQLAEDQQLRSALSLAISADGRQLIYVANHRLYVRSMSELDARPIAGTESADTLNPVFSPDGQSVAFSSATDQTLKRVPVGGGRAMTICHAGYSLGIAWSDDKILFSQLERGIMQVSADGGTPEVLVAVTPGETAYAPQPLPGGSGTLFTVASSAMLEHPRLVVQTAGTRERKTLIEGAADGRYLPTGQIVYSVEGRLFAVSFDVRRLKVTSAPVPVLEGVARAMSTATGTFAGTALWAVSPTGTLVYVPGPASASSYFYNLAVRDPAGRIERLKLPSDTYQSPRFSPDGRFIAFGTDDGNNADLWIYDTAETSAARRLTFEGRNRFPTWSADGRHIAFQSNRAGDLAIFSQRVDGGGSAERLTKADRGTMHIPESWSPRGDVLSFSAGDGSRYSLWTLSLRDKHATRLADVESQIPPSSAFSPDGRWLAYNTFSPPAAFVRRWPVWSAKYQLPDSALNPVWFRDGKQLLYSVGPPPVHWVVANVSLQPSFAIGNPVRLSVGDLQTWRPDWWRHYDIAADGRIVGLIPSDKALTPGTRQPIQVVLNWFEELKQRVPAE